MRVPIGGACSPLPTFPPSPLLDCTILLRCCIDPFFAWCSFAWPFCFFFPCTYWLVVPTTHSSFTSSSGSRVPSPPAPLSSTYCASDESQSTLCSANQQQAPLTLDGDHGLLPKPLPLPSVNARKGKSKQQVNRLRRIKRTLRFHRSRRGLCGAFHSVSSGAV